MGARFCLVLTLSHILCHELVGCLQGRAHCWLSLALELEVPRSPDTHRGTKAQARAGAVGHGAGGGVATCSEGGTVRLRVHFQPGEVGGQMPSPARRLLPAQGSWRSGVVGEGHSLWPLTFLQAQDAGPRTAALDRSPPRAQQLPGQLRQPTGGQCGGASATPAPPERAAWETGQTPRFRARLWPLCVHRALISPSAKQKTPCLAFQRT